MVYVKELGFEEKPNYALCRGIFREAYYQINKSIEPVLYEW